MTKSVDIEHLRAQIWSMEYAAPLGARIASMGVEAVDRALPWGGLPLGRLHQIMGRDGAAIAFTAALLARLSETKPVMWCVREGSDDDTLYGPGLSRFGLTPERLVIVRVKSETDLLWAMEEGLRCPGLAAVVGQVGRMDLSAGRRLQLAAEDGGVTGVLLHLTPADLPPSSATTRWSVHAAPSRGQAPSWHVSLECCRQGKPAAWFLDWDDETHNLALATDLCH